MQMRSLIFSVILIIATPASSQDASAQCRPTWATPDMPIIENTFHYWSAARNGPVEIGPRLDAEMYYWTRGTLFQLPYGFFNPWSLSRAGSEIQFPELSEYLSNLEENSARSGYDASTGLFNPDLLEVEDTNTPMISFWMPSLRYVEQNMRTSYDFRPCEPGREPASENEYVVQFRIQWASADNIDQSPQVKQLKNAQLRPLSDPNVLQYFEEDYYVRLHCTQGGGCDGWIWDRDYNYILYIMFPEFLRDDDPEQFWRTPVNASVALIESWKVKGNFQNGD